MRRFEFSSLASGSPQRPSGTSASHNPAAQWRPDLLGPDFQHAIIDLGTDPEGQGTVLATVVRYLPHPNSAPRSFFHRPALLWVHGLDDYFFHEHVARYFHERGFAFYAVDLRKSGRSHQPGQRWHDAHSLARYFPDLTRATRIIAHDHPSVIPLAHSTGGLITALWLNHIADSDSALYGRISAMILNSPWLAMQFPPTMTLLARIGAATLGRVAPSLPVPQPRAGRTTYVDSIHRDFHGQWDFDLRLKPRGGHTRRFGWLHAIFAGQDHLRLHSDLTLPILVLVSHQSWLGQDYAPTADSSDTVLDVSAIRRRARVLGNDVTVHTVDGARHDVFLSMPLALEDAFGATYEWLTAQQLAPAIR